MPQTLLTYGLEALLQKENAMKDNKNKEQNEMRRREQEKNRSPMSF